MNLLSGHSCEAVHEAENRVFQVTVANDLVAEVAEVSTVRSLMQSDQSKWGGLTKTCARVKQIQWTVGAAMSVAANVPKPANVTAITPAARVPVLVLVLRTVGLGRSAARAGRASEAESLSHWRLLK